ncbi:oligosaccharide flippase family protein [Enterococcus faecium]|uniref:lipopolysaccharide biosynthesis protein n=1 Tax=Enterococcus faecium TaxID=1352 RepID=UPI001F067706|nr:oligosaccharide flippase family protein [Enterococcus faecium]MCH1661445.1 oligosaccharide flippase family protein [Enterococcus faecium]WDW18515.1 oligosaccharide flippase family protein [Enterococcus faecium]
MSNQRRAGAVLSYLNIILKNVINFLYVPLLLRLVGQADYGLFQMTNSVTSSLTILSMGLSSAYVKFYIEYKTKNNEEEIRNLNGLYLVLFILIGIISLIIGLVLVLNISSLFGSSLSPRELELTKKLMIILVLNIAITFPSSVFDSNIVVNQHFVFQQTRMIFQTVLVPVLSVALMYLGFGILSIGLTQLFITSVYLIINIKYCRKQLNMKFTFKNFKIVVLKQLLAFSFFILLNQIVDMINNNAPNFIIGMVMGARDVATFAIALQIKNMFFMLSTSLSSVFVPQVNELVSSNKPTEILTDLMIRVGRIQMTILFFILGGFVILGRFFISIWAGNENIVAYSLIIMMVLPSIIPLSQNIGIEIQRAQNKHIFRSISYSIFAVFNIGITYFGAKYFGLEGASFGYIFSVLFANGFLMNWYYHAKLSLNMKKFWRNSLPVVIPFFVATGIGLLIQKYIPVQGYLQFFIQGLLYVLIFYIIYVKWIATNYEKKQINIMKRIGRRG